MTINDLDKLAALLKQERNALLSRWRQQMRQLPSARLTVTMPGAKELLRGVILVLTALLSGIASQAVAASPTELEIGHLLGYVERSACEFYRNGEWHSGADARAHLETKYRYFRFRGSITTTEDFIARTATSSSLTGQPYQVKCNHAEPVSSAGWLTAELVRLRGTSALP